MALTTYAELQTAVADFLNRDDLTASIPTFITLAEASMQRKLRHFQMEKRATTTANAQYSALPEDFLQPIRVHISGQNEALDAITPTAMQDRRIDNATGEPRFYTITANELELYPTPGSDYTLELYYYRTLPKLSDVVTENWLLAAAPDAYLYGSLIHSAPYLKDDARIVVWASLFQAAIDEIMADSNATKWGGANLVIK